jgi:hypothetical protein
MPTSAECRERAAEKTAEAEGDTRHKKRLLTAVEGWLILAGVMEQLEKSVASNKKCSLK